MSTWSIKSGPFLEPLICKFPQAQSCIWRSSSGRSAMEALLTFWVGQRLRKRGYSAYSGEYSFIQLQNICYALHLILSLSLKRKFLGEGARVMAISYCLKLQNFHFPACNWILSAAPRNQKISLTSKQVLYNCCSLWQWISRLFTFLFLILIFSLYYFGTEGVDPGSLRFSCSLFYFYIATNILLREIFPRSHSFPVALQRHTF